MSAYPSLADKVLIALLKGGDEQAFTEIYRRYWKLLFYTAMQILQEHEKAKDIVQNVFISVWDRRQVAEVQELKPYLKQACRYQVLKKIREQKNDALFYERLKDITTEILVENPLLLKEQQLLLQQLHESLPEKERETFRLSREEGLTYKQIASRLQVSEKTIEKRMSKSLRHFREGLNWELCVAIILTGNHNL